MAPPRRRGAAPAGRRPEAPAAPFPAATGPLLRSPWAPPLLLLLLCARPALGAVRNITVYRVTPRNYSTPINMDSADAAGDTYFGLFKMGYPAACRNSTVGICTPSTRIPGFNVYIQFVIEVDDRFGPYSQCNPDAATGIYKCSRWFGDGGCWFNSTSHPEWREDFRGVCSEGECECATLLDKAVGRETLLESTGPVPKFPPRWPQQCKRSFFPLGRLTFDNKSSRVLRVFTVEEEGDCCSACTAAAPPEVPTQEMCQFYKFWRSTGTCALVQLLNPWAKPVESQDRDLSSGYRQAPPTAAVQAWNEGFAYLQKVMMPGQWYSTSDKGLCKEGQVVGRDCWWRLVERARIVNSSCVDERMIQSVVGRNRTCFDGCGVPEDRASDCWITCFFSVVRGTAETPGVSREEALLPFESAFLEPARGGCPSVPPCPEPCLPPCWAVEAGQPCSGASPTPATAAGAELVV